MDQKTKKILIGIKRYLIVKKILTITCYLIILCGLMLYFFHGFSNQNKIQLITDYEINKAEYLSEKTMINPKIILQYNQSDIYNIKASKAVHKTDNEIILQDVFAEGNIGKISAGQLKISEDGNKLIFSINPVLILK
jgi:hypothetical protein